ncbi:MAG: cytochrome c [Bdellovibrionaceae bacterium]|nr:cytochrome c [Pseudobdellovibrionaceae bacterium]MBX3033495.1 cytochrome c [Pseudobdellovibrionaceae bacterium]
MKISVLKDLMILGCAGALAACSGGDKPNVELIQDMMQTPALKAQSYDEASPNHASMRVPAEHTVPVGYVPYKYGTNVEQASKELKNPLAGDTSEPVMWTGIRVYETQCSICHGPKGEGGEASKSPVSELMALKPPSLLTDKVRSMSDGHIYHIITMGQGVMGPYNAHVPQKDRWQLVNFIRHLQKNAK